MFKHSYLILIEHALVTCSERPEIGFLIVNLIDFIKDSVQDFEPRDPVSVHTSVWPYDERTATFTTSFSIS